jgi:hypothetical protein
MSNIKIENTEILSRLNVAEGSCDSEPDSEEVRSVLYKEGFLMYDFDKFYDGFQSVWRWTCKIQRNN